MFVGRKRAESGTSGWRTGFSTVPMVEIGFGLRSAFVPTPRIVIGIRFTFFMLPRPLVPDSVIHQLTNLAPLTMPSITFLND